MKSFLFSLFFFFTYLQLYIALHPIQMPGVTNAKVETLSCTLFNIESATGYSECVSSVCGWVSLWPLTLLRGAGDVEEAVETAVDPQPALGHSELLQVAVESEGVRPVQPDDRQVAVHRERGHVLGG